MRRIEVIDRDDTTPELQGLEDAFNAIFSYTVFCVSEVCKMIFNATTSRTKK